MKKRAGLRFIFSEFEFWVSIKLLMLTPTGDPSWLFISNNQKLKNQNTKEAIRPILVAGWPDQMMTKGTLS